MESSVPNYSNLSNQDNQDEKPTTCGLPDCKGPGGSPHHKQKGAPEENERISRQPRRCNMPGCSDGEACARGTVICLYNQTGTSKYEKFEGPDELPLTADGPNEASESRSVLHGQNDAPKVLPECHDGEGCATGNVNCLPAIKSATSNENDMAKCGLPACRSKTNNHKQDGDRFKGTCGLHDCHNEASASRARRNSRGEGPAGEKTATSSAGGKRATGPTTVQKPCSIPGCMDEEARAAGLEVCLYRRQPTTGFISKIGCVYQKFWKVWQKLQSDPYYWSLFKSIIFFVMGLKLYSDMAAAMNEPPVPKCPKRKS